MFLPLWESVIVLCFVVRYFMSILVLQSSWWGRESWLLCWSLVMVERLFLAVPRGCLQFVIVVFPDHTHLLFFKLFTIRRTGRLIAYSIPKGSCARLHGVFLIYVKYNIDSCACLFAYNCDKLSWIFMPDHQLFLQTLVFQFLGQELSHLR